MEASELRRALRILAHRMNDLRGARAAKFRVPALRPGPGECVLLKADNDTDELVETAINMLLAFGNRTRERESPSIGLEQLRR